MMQRDVARLELHRREETLKEGISREERDLLDKSRKVKIM